MSMAIQSCCKSHEDGSIHLMLLAADTFTAHCCRFHQDGSIHVSVTMAGYCACTFWESRGNQTAFEAPFGTQVGKNVLCNLHDHMSGWKVDLDVGGTNNTFINTVGCKAESRARHERGAALAAENTPVCM